MSSLSGPILVMLMINTFMFSYIAVMVFRQQRWDKSEVVVIVDFVEP